MYIRVYVIDVEQYSLGRKSYFVTINIQYAVEPNDSTYMG